MWPIGIYGDTPVSAYLAVFTRTSRNHAWTMAFFSFLSATISNHNSWCAGVFVGFCFSFFPFSNAVFLTFSSCEKLVSLRSFSLTSHHNGSKGHTNYPQKLESPLDVLALSSWLIKALLSSSHPGLLWPLKEPNFKLFLSCSLVHRGQVLARDCKS